MEFYSSLDASQLDAETPTLFELISAHQLESLLSPSLRYILVHYASKYPRYLLKINNRFDELNLLLRSFIEWYFLTYWQGSFTENFYGMKRVSQTPLSQGNFNSSKLTQLVPSLVEERRKLSTLQKLVSLFEITGLAYISEKLNYSYEVWYTKYVTNQLNTDESLSTQENLKIKIKRKFVEIYPYAQSAYRAANLLTTLLYLGGYSKSPTLLTYLFRINYSRLNQYDYAKNEPPPELDDGKKKAHRNRPPSPLEIALKFLSANVTNPTLKSIKFILGTFFPVAIFSLKFLEWWNNSDFSSKLSKNQGNVLDFTLPPPSTLTSALRTSRVEEKQKKKKHAYKSGKVCPLCKKELTNPAIIETGYVFDYTCIYNYLEKSHIIVSKKSQAKGDVDEDDQIYSDDEDEEKKEEVPQEEEEEKVTIDINKGGRCPITGRKLLGCKWNPIKEEWEIEGIRRLIF
ncbi:Peroxisome assembly protein 12 [Candida viswanathii]|uniref:Peroxisome assembly protein 12 n=1 Tax=Candida viswanathii TaxID=5486 RepID=A0A367YL69_9ASCO|nr:Peroxisome assembly protein 12 [Candida viswanathii]